MKQETQDTQGTGKELVLNAGQVEVMKLLFETVEKENFSNNAGVLNNFEPYRVLKAYVFGVDGQ